ncbi:hypothetical protein EDI_029090 [Entamoeba dispar SAW760]|uniref:Uncharacterized protein n=1 Tax=Entamoeba dispar (strain ATCC PRA-260 / SAW760) TaxID=370354 RepID=B0ENW6_ENTDS|nr:uncharacterized protein EDI_029090 [Entamoeba dispar SAW760]EDR23781.1 hypothetical protein EDI_029090 [Entamoeba dispar SAW760]|eukprot:EDR23781.1 hypothetical protein EDI_029090 [Entamoeba dispar SAW760]
MLMFYIIMLINCINADEYDCIPKGHEFKDGFESGKDKQCESLSNNYSYYFNKNFTYSGLAFNCNRTYLDGKFTMTSLYDYWSANVIEVMDNSQINLNGRFHTYKEFNIGTNSIVFWIGHVSFKHSITFETTPSLNQPQIIIWKSDYIHLYKPAGSQISKFEVNNPINNKQCFDVMSFNNNAALDFDKKSFDHYLPKDFKNGLDMLEGKAYLISNNRLMRFCPNGTDLDTSVTCTMNGNNYNLSYSGNDNQPFNYPHCPCDDNGETECILNIQQNLNTVNFNNNIIKYTTLNIDHDIILYNFISVKQINVNDDITLLIAPVSSIKEYTQKIQFNNFEITNNREKNVMTQFKYNSTTNTLEINGNNKLKHSSNPTNKPLTLIINGILTCNSFVNKSVYYFTNSSSSTPLININNNNGNNNIMIFDETVRLNGQLSNCIVLTGKSNEKFKCIQCKKGYYLNSKQECQYNSHCNKINKQSHCIECEYGYYLNSNKECQILPDNCIVRYKTYCYQCKEGFIKEKGECQKNDNKCNKSERNYCLKCSNGYK